MQCSKYSKGPDKFKFRLLRPNVLTFEHVHIDRSIISKYFFKIVSNVICISCLMRSTPMVQPTRIIFWIDLWKWKFYYKVLSFLLLLPSRDISLKDRDISLKDQWLMVLPAVSITTRKSYWSTVNLFIWNIPFENATDIIVFIS